VKARVHHNPGLDPADPATWPPILRPKDICKAPDYPGILPITSSAWRDHVSRGVIRPPIKFGRVNGWHRDYIARLQRDGIPGRRAILTAQGD
jgi:hypothetical protein